MDLTLDSGQVISNPTEQDIRNRVTKSRYAILSHGDNSYIQCHVNERPPFDFILEYQAGTIKKHFKAVGGPITADRVVRAFCKYLRGESWGSEFRWAKVDPRTFRIAEDDDERGEAPYDPAEDEDEDEHESERSADGDALEEDHDEDDEAGEKTKDREDPRR
jgi:hypothetical protein